MKSSIHRSRTSQQVSARVLSLGLIAASLVHFVAPQIFERGIPSALPGAPNAWIYGSGVAELLCGLAIARPQTRRTGATAAAVLFIAVFPGNIEMLRTADSDSQRLLFFLRLPFQIPLIIWALRVRARF